MVIRVGDRIADMLSPGTGVVWAVSHSGMSVKIKWFSGEVSLWIRVGRMETEIFCGELRYLHTPRTDK